MCVCSGVLHTILLYSVQGAHGQPGRRHGGKSFVGVGYQPFVILRFCCAGPRALMDSLDAYVAATGRNVTVLPPGRVFAYDWHRVRLHVDGRELECSR